MPKFGQQVADFQRKAEAKYRALAREAVQETVSIAQTLESEGGRMHFDTGFLRASIQGKVGEVPSGPTVNEGNKKYEPGQQVAGEEIAVTLLKWDPMKDVLYIGWTANYARYREAQDGFVRGAAEIWDRTVKKANKKVGNRLG